MKIKRLSKIVKLGLLLTCLSSSGLNAMMTIEDAEALLSDVNVENIFESCDYENLLKVAKFLGSKQKDTKNERIAKLNEDFLKIFFYCVKKSNRNRSKYESNLSKVQKEGLYLYDTGKVDFDSYTELYEKQSSDNAKKEIKENLELVKTAICARKAFKKQFDLLEDLGNQFIGFIDKNSLEFKNYVNKAIEREKEAVKNLWIEVCRIKKSPQDPQNANFIHDDKIIALIKVSRLGNRMHGGTECDNFNALKKNLRDKVKSFKETMPDGLRIDTDSYVKFYKPSIKEKVKIFDTLYNNLWSDLSHLGLRYEEPRTLDSVIVRIDITLEKQFDYNKLRDLYFASCAWDYFRIKSDATVFNKNPNSFSDITVLTNEN